MTIDTARQARTTLRGLPAEARKILFKYRHAKLQAMEHPPRQRRLIVEKLTADHQAELARLEATYKQASESFRSAVTKARRKPNPMGTDEALAWERLRNGLDVARRADPSRSLAQGAMARLERALAEGDTAMLRAARTMLPDHLAAHDDGLGADNLRWLDIQAGDADTQAAVALDEEGRTGLQHVLGALDWARSEIKGELGANVMPTWEGGVTEFDMPPDYESASAMADAEAANVLAAAGYRPTSDRAGIVRTGGSGPGGDSGARGR